MAIVAHAHPFVIGVDTHARSHAVAVLDTSTGARIDAAQFPSSKAGLARAIDWAGRRTGGDMASLWVIEGIGTYGAGLARAAAQGGYPVVEAARMNARGHRGIGKSDPLDAQRIAAAVLPLDITELRHPRRDEGTRAALRVLVAARDHMTGERTGTVNALTGLVRSTDLGLDARRPLTTRQINEISAWRTRTEDIGSATARAEAVRLARRVLALDAELTANQTRMSELIS
jgi:transposase